MSSRLRDIPIFPLLMVAAGVSLVLGSVFWVVNIPPPDVTSISAVGAVKIPHPEIQRISVEDSKTAFDQGAATFIDTRGEPYFSQGHIPHALSITEEELASQLDRLNPSGWIIIYCT